MVEGSGSLKTFAGLGVARHGEIYLSEILALGVHGAAGESKNCESKRITQKRFHNASFVVCQLLL
jgi:hypothetical protein